MRDNALIINMESKNKQFVIHFEGKTQQQKGLLIVIVAAGLVGVGVMIGGAWVVVGVRGGGGGAARCGGGQYNTGRVGEDFLTKRSFRSRTSPGRGKVCRNLVGATAPKRTETRVRAPRHRACRVRGSRGANPAGCVF